MNIAVVTLLTLDVHEGSRTSCGGVRGRSRRCRGHDRIRSPTGSASGQRSLQLVCVGLRDAAGRSRSPYQGNLGRSSNWYLQVDALDVIPRPVAQPAMIEVTQQQGYALRLRAARLEYN